MLDVLTVYAACLLDLWAYVHPNSNYSIYTKENDKHIKVSINC